MRTLIITGGPNKNPAIKYIADFVITYPDGKQKVIDVKGFRTKDYTIKMKMLLYKYPYLDFDKKKLTTGITNYFELDLENLVYNIFLVGDFDKDKYYVKIGER